MSNNLLLLNSEIIINNKKYFIDRVFSNRKNKSNLYNALKVDNGIIEEFIIKQFKKNKLYKLEKKQWKNIYNAQVIHLEFNDELKLVIMQKGKIINKILSDNDKLIAVKNAAFAIQSLHNIGYVHRDINASNIVYLDDNVSCIKLIDFELVSKIGEVSTIWGGTPGYTPDDFNFETDKVDTWLDIYAFAVTLLHVFTDFHFKSFIPVKFINSKINSNSFYNQNKLFSMQLNLIDNSIKNIPYKNIAIIITSVLIRKDKSINMQKIFNLLRTCKKLS